MNLILRQIAGGKSPEANWLVPDKNSSVLISLDEMDQVWSSKIFLTFFFFTIKKFEWYNYEYFRVLFYSSLLISDWIHSCSICPLWKLHLFDLIHLNKWIIKIKMSKNTFSWIYENSLSIKEFSWCVEKNIFHDRLEGTFLFHVPHKTRSALSRFSLQDQKTFSFMGGFLCTQSLF